MQLKFNLDGPAEPLIKYFDDFYKIRPELLLEIDPTAQKFVCKLFVENRNCARYSSITFNECNLTVTSNDEAYDNIHRIKLGLGQMQFSKFISILKQFSIDTSKNDASGCTFDINITYDVLTDSENNFSYIVTKVACVSPKLTMRIVGFRVSEFIYSTDEDYKSMILSVENPVKFNIDSNTITSLIKYSDIIKSDERKDMLIFYNKGNELWVRSKCNADKDKENVTEPGLEYKLATSDTTLTYDINLAIFKHQFTMMLNRISGQYTIVMGQRMSKAGISQIDRFILYSANADTNIVIGMAYC